MGFLIMVGNDFIKVNGADAPFDGIMKEPGG